jgi:hypothetical protein
MLISALLWHKLANFFTKGSEYVQGESAPYPYIEYIQKREVEYDRNHWSKSVICN